MYFNTNLSLKERTSAVLSGFRGVDLSNPVMSVAQNRATYMRNFINVNGTNRKRHGWDQVVKFKDSNDAAAEVNGIFQFTLNGVNFIIVYAGKMFFKVTKTTDSDGHTAWSSTNITSTCTYSPASINTALLKNAKTSCFVRGNRAYFIGCGDYLVFGTWDDENYELRRVFNDEDTYIPTTTVNIHKDGTENDIRSTLDDVNLLCSRRKNKFVGDSVADGATFTVDTKSIDVGTKVEIVYTDSNGDEHNYSNALSGDVYGTTIYDDATTPNAVGSLVFATGKITFSGATTPQTADRDNIVVTFYKATEGNEEQITKCHFGTLFGVNGNSDRLFLSGNSDTPNIDWHSEEDDFTYFGDMNTAVMGSENCPVMGYARLSDSTLVIYKAHSTQESNIFFRVGEYKTTYESDGETVKTIKGVFPTTAGAIGEGVVSHWANCSLGGDVLILSTNGVFGIELADNVVSQQRFAKERSRFINDDLKKYADLSGAVAIAYQNRYYLSIDGMCYVADARFKATADGDMSDTVNYEWWIWNNIPANVWGVIDSVLCFGTKNGQLCVFDNEYTDRGYDSLNSGDLAVSPTDDKFTYNSDFDIAEGDLIKLTSDVFYSFIDSSAIEDIVEVPDTVHGGNGNRYAIQVSADIIQTLNDGTEVYIDSVGTSGLVAGTKYIIADVDMGARYFFLTNSSGEYVSVSDTTDFNIRRSLKGQLVTICDVNEIASKFKVKIFADDESAVDIVAYNSQNPPSPTASLYIVRNVVAEWQTPAFDFGSNAHTKTLVALSITTEAIVNGQLQVAWETRAAFRTFDSKGISYFSFDDMDFNNFTFDMAFATSYTRKVKENFNYIIFSFKSDNNRDCAVNSFTIQYKVNSKNKGVK